MPVLDDLRGIAILLVVVYHGVTTAFGFVPPEGGTFWLSFVYAGNTGVTLFFLLSGILVSRPFFTASAVGRAVDLRHYALQRALRILPPYYLMVVLGVVLTGHYERIPQALAFVAWGQDIGVFSNVWWSLATEIQFYLLLPLAFLLRARGRGWLIALLLAWLAVFVALCMRWISFGLSGNIYWVLSLGGKLPAFLVGVAIAWSHENGRLPRISILPVSGALILVAGLLACFLEVMVARGVVEYSWKQPWVIIPESLLWGAVALLLLAGEVSASGPLSWVLRYLGKISYSLYLVHLPLIVFCLSQQARLPVVEHFPAWGRLVLGWGLALLAAHLCHWLIEMPFLSLKRRYSSKLQDSEALPV